VILDQSLQQVTETEMSSTTPPGPPNVPPPAGFDLPDDNHNAAILVSSAVTTGIALVVVCMRIFVRARIVRSVGGDDWWIVAATVCTRCQTTLSDSRETNHY